MTINGVEIEDTFAEAFGMAACRVIVTAIDEHWVQVAAAGATGYGCSVLGCDAEAGVEARIPPEETADGRPGASLLFFGFKTADLETAVTNRIGQTILTCATTACYNGITETDRFLNVGGKLRFFGDGHQMSKLFGGRRFWRIPVMDGEFVCEEHFGTIKGIAGGNFLILATSQKTGLMAAEAAIAAIERVPDVITPFPGGIVRSGSKVGSRYKKLRASTNEAYCPTLRGTVKTDLPEGTTAVYEIVIDGLNRSAIETAMRVGIQAACIPGIVKISAGNYGGRLGPHHFRLFDVLSEAPREHNSSLALMNGIQ